jgi:multicomponent Na+:H+ antiporter subunit G
MSTLSTATVALGCFLLLVSALGLFRLPNALARQHAATKSVTLSLGLILIGASFASPDWGFVTRSGAIFAIILLSSPIASHMLARAAARHAYTTEEMRDAPRIEPHAQNPET